MANKEEAVQLNEIENTPLRNILAEDTRWKADLNYCMSCGKCLSVCPLHEYSEWDPRKVVRLTLLGLEQEVIDSDFIYQCTGCERCSSVCPMGVKIGNLITRARTMRPRDQVPGGSQKTADLHRTVGNNMGIATEE